MLRNRAGLAAFVLLLVAVTFARAQFASSTGIRIAGDGSDYATMAAAMELRGRAPFVYRPALPLTVGLLFADNLLLGFSIVCAGAMFVALFSAGVLAGDRLAGYFIATILLLNYQVFFAAANVARLDMVVLAVQLGFVALALRRDARLFFWLLPLTALLKESMFLGLGALALAAFPRDKQNVIRAAVATLGCVAVQLGIRWIATPTGAVAPYTEGGVSPATMWLLLTENLSWALPLHFFVAWSGLAFIALYLAFAGGERRATLIAGSTAAFLLLFPLPLATDVHRAWFELLAPLVLFDLLGRTSGRGRYYRSDPTQEDGPLAGDPANRFASVYPALGLAAVASALPYAARVIAPEHLHLLVLQERVSTAASVALAISVSVAAAALYYWVRPET